MEIEKRRHVNVFLEFTSLHLLLLQSESRRVTVDPCEREKLESLLLFSRKEESLFGWMEVLAFLIVNFSSVSREYLRT